MNAVEAKAYLRFAPWPQYLEIPNGFRSYGVHLRLSADSKLFDCIPRDRICVRWSSVVLHCQHRFAPYRESAAHARAHGAKRDDRGDQGEEGGDGPMHREAPVERLAVHDAQQDQADGDAGHQAEGCAERSDGGALEREEAQDLAPVEPEE